MRMMSPHATNFFDLESQPVDALDEFRGFGGRETRLSCPCCVIHGGGFCRWWRGENILRSEMDLWGVGMVGLRR